MIEQSCGNIVVEARNLWRSFRKAKTVGGPINMPTAIVNYVYRRLKGQYESVSYALRDVSFTVRESEFVLMLGPNGAGKTTLLKILAGILPYSKGSLKIFGEDPYSSREHLREVRRRVSLIPNVMLGTAFFDAALSVERNLMITCELLGLNPARALKMADLFDLKDYLDTRLGALSTGLVARAVLALHLAKEADLYLFDEPAVALSPEGRMLFKRLLEELKREGRTVIYATHYPSELVDVFDKVLILCRGRKLFYGTTLDFTNTVFKGKDTCIEIELYNGYRDVFTLGGEVEVSGNRARIYCSSSEAYELLKEIVSSLREGYVRRIKVIPRSFEEAYIMYLGVEK